MVLDATMRALADFAAFRPMGNDALRLVALTAEARILRAGAVLFRRGEAADGAVIVASGAVELRGVGEPVTVGPPALFGETALLVETRRPATAVTRQTCSVLQVSRALYLRVLREYPDVAAAVHRQAVERIAALREDYEAAGRRLEGGERDAAATRGR